MPRPRARILLAGLAALLAVGCESIPLEDALPDASVRLLAERTDSTALHFWVPVDSLFQGDSVRVQVIALDSADTALSPLVSFPDSLRRALGAWLLRPGDQDGDTADAPLLRAWRIEGSDTVRLTDTTLLRQADSLAEAILAHVSDD